jgi:hypothetical protein
MSNKLKFQWAKAAAMFSNYQEIIKNWGLAVNSMGFTDNQVKNQMDSLSRRINKLKADLTGLVAQGGNSGLTEWLKECVAELDRLAKFLSTVDASTYRFIGSMTKLLMIMYLVNRALRMIRASGISAGFVEMASAFGTAETAAIGLAGGLTMLRKAVRLLKAATVVGIASVIADWGIDKLDDVIEGDTEAINKQTDAIEENFAAKSQEIEQYNQQEQFVTSLLDAHQKLTAEIENSTDTDKKKAQLLEDRTATEQELAKVIGDSAMEQLEADNWTTDSVNKVKDNYIQATNDKKRSLALWMMERANEAKQNYDVATNSLKYWEEERKAFVYGNDQKIRSLMSLMSVTYDYWRLSEFVHSAEQSWYQAKANVLHSRMKALGKQIENDDWDGQYESEEQAVAKYKQLGEEYDEAKAAAEKAGQDVESDRGAEFEAFAGDAIKDSQAKFDENARLLTKTLSSGNDLLAPKDYTDYMKGFNYDPGAGGDEYNHTPSGKSKHSHTPKQKTSNIPWEYGDTTSQMLSELSKKFEASFGTKNGLDMATLSAIITKLTGIGNLEFDAVSDPFGTGGRNTWESGRLFYQKAAPYLAQGLGVVQMLSHLTPTISEEEWKSYLGNESAFLRKTYNYSKNDQKFSDPNEQPGGLYDLGGSSGGSASVGGESYVGSDTDEAHLWELAVMAANKSNKIKDPRLFWLIMMHESGRGKDPIAKKNHNFAGIGGGHKVDMMSDELFVGQFVATLDNMFKSTPNNIGELVYGMYTNHYFTGDAEAYQSDLNAIDSEGLVGGSSSNNQTPSSSAASIGDAVYDEALKESAERKGEALGANTCAAFVSYVTRGIGANTGIDDPLVKNWVDSAQSRGAWVDSSLGQTAPKGSLVVWSREGEPDGNPWMHIGISDGQGGWISSDTHGLKHHTGLDSYYSGNGYTYAGYIDMSKLTNGQTVAGYATPKKPSFWNGHKSSLADFTRNEIAETIFDQDRQQKLYEARKKNIEYQMKIQGDTYELLRANDANEKAYYEAVEKNRQGWIDKYDELTDAINENLNEHVEIKQKLNGKNIFDMPQDELRKLTDLAKGDDPELGQLIENLFKVRERLSEANSKLVELRVDKKIRDGYMKPEQDEDYRLKRIEEWYSRTTSNKTDGEKYMDTHELYQSQIAIYKERLKRQNEGLMNARRRDQEQLEEYYEQLDDIQNGNHNEKGELVEKGLAQYKGDNSEEAKAKIAELKAKLKDLQENIDQLSKHGSENFQKMQKDVEDTEAQIRELTEKDNEVTKNLWDTIENDVGDMFFDIIKQGSSFKESWKKLWDDVAKIALQQILRMTVNRWLFNARTTIDDAISKRNAGKNTAINAGAGLLGGASKFTATPKKWNQVKTGNPYLDRYNGVTSDNFFPMKSNGTNVATSINKFVKETSKLSSVTQKAATLTNASNALTQTATAKDALNTSAITTQTAATQAQTLQMQALTEAIIMAGTPKPTISLGGHAMGGLLTTAYANGGMISGAGTGKSDSILAYLADKDRFVFLSNGEYVMTAEATSRIGKDNLDAMNYGAFADGGALNPTPYVPQISPRVAKRAEGIRVTNPNARMEQLMQEQTDTIKNMGNSDGSGNVVVLNTHASSDDVMNAIQRNPRAFQSILHNQKRHGFR